MSCFGIWTKTERSCSVSRNFAITEINKIWAVKLCYNLKYRVYKVLSPNNNIAQFYLQIPLL